MIVYSIKNNPVNGRVDNIRCIPDTQVFTVTGCTFERSGTVNSVPIRFANQRNQDTINILNNRVKNGTSLYESDVSGSWEMLNCWGNTNHRNVEFRPTGDSNAQGVTLHQVSQAKLFKTESFTTNQPDNWARMGTTPVSVAQRIGF